MKNEIEKLKIEINKRQEYEFKLSEEYQRLNINFQQIEQENKIFKGEEYNAENESNINKKNSIKEKEVKNILKKDR